MLIRTVKTVQKTAKLKKTNRPNRTDQKFQPPATGESVDRPPLLHAVNVGLPDRKPVVNRTNQLFFLYF